jgi:hypothetical protein
LSVYIATGTPGVKGHYVKSITLAATMTPGVPVAM